MDFPHYHAPSHKIITMKSFWQKAQKIYSYLPDTALYNFFSLLKLKLTLQGRCQELIEAIEENSLRESQIISHQSAY